MSIQYANLYGAAFVISGGTHPTLQNSKAEIFMLQVPRDEEGEPTFDELICPACVPKCSFVSKYQRYVVAPMSAPTTGTDPVVNKEEVNMSGMRICSTLTSTCQLGTYFLTNEYTCKWLD
jgi:hypothetical protein